MTNADKIRAMDDCDLHKFICKMVTYCDSDCPFYGTLEKPCTLDEWLSAPAESEG